MAAGTGKEAVHAPRDAAARSPGGHEDRRGGGDRRRVHPLLADWRWAFRGRRRQVRRGVDRNLPTAVLDWYEPRLLPVVLGIFVLSAADASLTLELIGRGIATEANPVMRLLMSLGVSHFVGVKTLVTGVALVALAAYSTLVVFSRLRLESVLHWVLGLYAILVGSQLTMLAAHG